MAKHISKHITDIADAHINARQLGRFDNPICKSHTDMYIELLQGKTIENVLESIEKKFVVDDYRLGIYKGFAVLLG